MHTFIPNKKWLQHALRRYSQKRHFLKEFQQRAKISEIPENNEMFLFLLACDSLENNMLKI